jgi:thioredoxin 1
MVVELTKNNINEQVKNADKPAILDIYAEWCGPCKQMKPIFEQLEKELGDNYVFGEINVDESRDLAIEYGVTSVPTFVFLKNNEIKGKETGYMDQEELKNKITEYLG